MLHASEDRQYEFYRVLWNESRLSQVSGHCVSLDWEFSGQTDVELCSKSKCNKVAGNLTKNNSFVPELTSEIPEYEDTINLENSAFKAIHSFILLLTLASGWTSINITLGIANVALKTDIFSSRISPINFSTSGYCRCWTHHEEQGAASLNLKIKRY